MQQITRLSIEVLKVHPRNQEFFDDIDGDNYESFKKSIQEDGIITPLIVAPDMTVVSGHQRLKACRDLGVKQVPVIIREDLDDEDEKLKKLLATNFGRIKNDPNKQRKVAVQYVELCGNKHGTNQWKDDNRLSLEEIAKQLGTSKTTLKELLEIERKLTPEIKELLNTGVITKTSASKIWTKLSDDEQLELLEELGKQKIEEMTQQQLKQYIYEKERLEKEKQELRVALDREKNKPKAEKIIDNTDYDAIDRLKNDVEKLKKDKTYYEEKTNNLQKQLELYKKDSKEYENLKLQIESLSKEKNDIGRQIESTVSLSKYVVSIDRFLKTELAPIQYNKSLLEAKDNPIVIQNLKDIVSCVEKWCHDIKEYLPNEYKNIVDMEEYR